MSPNELKQKYYSRLIFLFQAAESWEASYFTSSSSVFFPQMIIVGSRSAVTAAAVFQDIFMQLMPPKQVSAAKLWAS